MRVIEVEQAKEWLVHQLAMTDNGKEKAMISQMIGMLYILPATDRMEWVACSKKPPKADQDVLLDFGKQMVVGHMRKAAEGGSQEWVVSSGNGWYSPLEESEGLPIAWMPLPTEYKSA